MCALHPDYLVLVLVHRQAFLLMIMIDSDLIFTCKNWPICLVSHASSNNKQIPCKAYKLSTKATVALVPDKTRTVVWYGFEYGRVRATWSWRKVRSPQSSDIIDRIKSKRSVWKNRPYGCDGEVMARVPGLACRALYVGKCTITNCSSGFPCVLASWPSGFRSAHVHTHVFRFLEHAFWCGHSVPKRFIITAIWPNICPQIVGECCPSACFKAIASPIGCLHEPSPYQCWSGI